MILIANLGTAAESSPEDVPWIGMAAIKVRLLLAATLDMCGNVVQSGQVKWAWGADDTPRECGTLGHMYFFFIVRMEGTLMHSRYVSTITSNLQKTMQEGEDLRDIPLHTLGRMPHGCRLLPLVTALPTWNACSPQSPSPLPCRSGSRNLPFTFHVSIQESPLCTKIDLPVGSLPFPPPPCMWLLCHLKHFLIRARLWVWTSA